MCVCVGGGLGHASPMNFCTMLKCFPDTDARACPGLATPLDLWSHRVLKKPNLLNVKVLVFAEPGHM